jgi:hydrogenase maturation protease
MIKVIGIGQTMRGDDAAGIRAVQYWQAAYPKSSQQPNVQVLIEELPGLALLDMLVGASFVVIADAVRSNVDPGTIHHLEITDLATFKPGLSSAHGWGLAETLALIGILGLSNMPEQISLVGIEAGDLNMGLTLSPPVTESLAQAAALIESLVTGVLATKVNGN